MKRLGALVLVLAAGPCAAQQFYAPDTISEVAQAELREKKSPALRPPYPAASDLPAWKRIFEEREASLASENAEVVRAFEPSVKPTVLGGVSVLDIRPKGWKDNRKVAVYLHGGGYTFLSPASTLTASVPVAQETGLRVISVDYTRAPFAKFRQITGEAIEVLKALQGEGYGLPSIAVYGDSAGGGLAAGVVLRMRDEGLGMPGAVVLWSPWADITQSGDTYRTLKDAETGYLYDRHLKSRAEAYADPADQKHPWVSPVYGDYSKGFPPTLIQGGTKEIFLSNFVRQYQALDAAGQVVKLDLYEGMWHVFQDSWRLPEAKLALGKMKRFLEQHLGAEDSAIRTAREEFNAAIVRRDAEAIARILAPGYHIVTGRSDQAHGVEAERDRWAARFAADPTVTYRRTPREIRVNEAWGLAEEAGDWVGSYAASDQRARASGVYSAKWQRAVDGRWLLQAEVFTTMTCEGGASACSPPEPISASIFPR